MAVAKVLGGGATMASMTARLISKLSLHQEDEPMDLGNLKSPGKGFITQRVKKRGPWSYQRAMILLNDYNRFSDIMAVPLDFFWIWVEVCDLPATLTTEATLWLVGETIRPVLNVD
ncbi:hypothetical protein ACLB2K_004571 [Fragaria x ananassa]